MNIITKWVRRVGQGEEETYEAGPYIHCSNRPIGRRWCWVVRDFAQLEQSDLYSGCRRETWVRGVSS